MKVLLRKDVDPLGIVGDVVDVSEGYARNYLFPQGLALQPTKGNMRALTKERAAAAERRRLALEQMRRAAQALEGVEVTIVAAANEEGVLYGSVGPREIAHALVEEGHPVKTEYVRMSSPLRHLDRITVEVRFAPDIKTEVKVWVVRERQEGEPQEGATETAQTTEGAANESGNG
ncbi:MAG: 50S ribosomal protein L9 [Phycisphaerae bacterium]|nr:MAG: 50S ribosomal protein L9 [Planctomycetota bacterium]KAB2946331.1 MAG: 50S ribosomal protein L9 [Phycisphaerae bacterium]MBE7455799.1 50S ribosomal protein L9 [Planctomycetia bacterium]MCK6463434.1 50S ribosomal protein L9 [Phycisphaerae bacterium]MCL4717056.1 50S ribosomal protein L9 [Phycisphaerae bacterium]